jgi:ABC-type multidrug transport system fused ATPase/permease subunit
MAKLQKEWIIFPLNIELLLNHINVRNIRHLLDRRERIRFSFLVAQMILAALLEFTGIALVLPFIKLAGNQLDIDSLPDFMAKWLSMYDREDLLIYSGFFIFFLIVLSTILKIYLSWREQAFVWDISHKLGVQQHKTILAQPYSFFIEKNSSEIITNLIVETSTVVRGILLPMAQIISNSIIAILFLTLITLLHPKISLIFMTLSFLVGVIMIGVLKNKLNTLGQKRVMLERARFLQLKESVIGIKTVKSSQKELFFLNKFADVSLRYSKIKPFVNTLNTIPRNILDIILFGGVILTVAVLMMREYNVTAILPSLTFYVFVGFKLLPTFQNIINAIITIRFSWPSLKTVFQDLDKPKAHIKRIGDEKRITFHKKLSLSNCYFGHQTDQFILKNVSVEIQKGHKVGIVGYSGSGKTTLVEILSGLLHPTKGHIHLDDQEILDENIDQLMQLVSFVPQDVFFFDDTIEKNITLEEDDSKVDQNKLKKILDILSLTSFVEELPKGLSTNVGELGVKLSGGQKQRFGFARALYKDPEILILDESTSALDYLTEMDLLSNLKKQLPELTVLKVAHRLKSVKDCDIIYFLDHGEIMAEGTFDEVVENNNLFKEMVSAGTI